VRPEGLGKMKKFIHLFGSRTLDLPACSTRPQPLLYRLPYLFIRTGRLIGAKYVYIKEVGRREGTIGGVG
jgi:hypothetical protein